MIIEQDDFLTIDECNSLIDYLKNNLVLDLSEDFWHGRTLGCTNINDVFIRKLVEQIHYRISNICVRSFDEDVIYPEYSNLVYWAPGMVLDAHADNFFLHDPSAEHYTSHRDYSSVIYLNDDYVGGETFFVDNRDIKPKVGKMILFTSGKDDVHGVREVISGDRFTMSLWFTKNKEKIHIV